MKQSDSLTQHLWKDFKRCMKLLFSICLILHSNAMFDNLFAQQSQNKTITGTVTDTAGTPVPGATVVIKGTLNGVTTDREGRFALIVPSDTKSLSVSFIGMKQLDIDITGKDIVFVMMAEEAVGLDEVVVVGYGTQKKESVVGAISQVKGSDLIKSGVPNVAGSLTGLVPGMITVQGNGTPGYEDPKIYIRGLSSFNGTNQPLVLVDGIERTLNDINPNDVESISVLKDASATAVFGVKGGNGVILITTKRGREGRMAIEVNVQSTIKKAVHDGIQEDAYNTLYYRDLLHRYQNLFDRVIGPDELEHYRLKDSPYIYPDVDSWDHAMKPFALDHQATITGSGGTKNAKYYVSLGYLHQSDLLKGGQSLYDAEYKYDRMNFRMNFDFDFTKTTRVSFSTNGYVGTRSNGGEAWADYQTELLSEIYLMPPYLTPWVYPASFVEQYPDPNNPEIGDRVAGIPTDPAAVTGSFKHSYTGNTKNIADQIGTDISLNQDLDAILKGLSFKSLFSYNSNSTRKGGGHNYYADRYVFMRTGNTYEWSRWIGINQDNYTVIKPPYRSVVNTSGNVYYNYVYSGQLNYNRSFGRHNISGLGLFSRRVSQSGASFPHYEENWVGRTAYNYDGKYLFEASVGISGSEQFAPANRFGYFPSVGFGWNIAKENFVKEVLPVISNFKVRFSYGETGNDNTGNQWLYLSDYTNWFNVALGNLGLIASNPTIIEGKVPNINAGWEIAKKRDLGIDVGLYNNSLNFTAELFSEDREGILMTRRSIADWFGQTVLPLNIGSTKRHGYELEAGWNKTVNTFHYWIKGNYNFTENRILNQDDPGLTPEYQKDAGKPIGLIRARYNIGYYSGLDEIANYSLRQNDLMTIGADKVLDFNGDGILDDNDIVPTKYSDRPYNTFALSGGMAYKSFDFNILFQGAFGVGHAFWDASNPMYTGSAGVNYIKIKGADDIWTPNNQNAKYANWGAWSPGSKGVLDAKYLRLKSFEIGYTLAPESFKRIGLSSARFFMQGSNLFTWAPGYILGDPENEYDGSLGSVSGNFRWYPIPKRITFNLKISF